MNLDATANHLFLLADHIKLGLSDNVNTIGQEKKIRQSLTALKNGITSLQRHRDSQTSAGQESVIYTFDTYTNAIQVLIM